eukprot:g1208.t1
MLRPHRLIFSAGATGLILWQARVAHVRDGQHRKKLDDISVNGKGVEKRQQQILRGSRGTGHFIAGGADDLISDQLQTGDVILFEHNSWLNYPLPAAASFLQKKLGDEKYRKKEIAERKRRRYIIDDDDAKTDRRKRNSHLPKIITNFRADHSAVVIIHPKKQIPMLFEVHPLDGRLALTAYDERIVDSEAPSILLRRLSGERTDEEDTKAWEAANTLMKMADNLSYSHIFMSRIQYVAKCFSRYCGFLDNPLPLAGHLLKDGDQPTSDLRITGNSAELVCQIQDAAGLFVNASGDESLHFRSSAVENILAFDLEDDNDVQNIVLNSRIRYVTGSIPVRSK